MEKALQECCRSMRIGKVLVDSDSETHEAHVVFAKFPDDIAGRKVLLLYPIMRSGNKVCKAVQVLKEHNVPEKHIILINLFCTPDARDRRLLVPAYVSSIHASRFLKPRSVIRARMVRTLSDLFSALMRNTVDP